MKDFGYNLVNNISCNNEINGVKIPASFISTPVKGNGLINKSNGLHTVQIITSNFTGNIKFEATLSSTIDDNVAWISINILDKMSNVTHNKLEYNYSLNTSVNPVQTNEIFYIIGQYSWIRANVSGVITGILQSIKLAF
jgi:hypothetical protein